MSISFDVPAQFLTRVSDGSLVRFGGLLKDSSSGQIVAHLQETGLVPHLLGAFPNLALPRSSTCIQAGLRSIGREFTRACWPVRIAQASTPS